MRRTPASAARRAMPVTIGSSSFTPGISGTLAMTSAPAVTSRRRFASMALLPAPVSSRCRRPSTSFTSYRKMSTVSRKGDSAFHAACPDVSRATWIPACRHSFATASANAGWASGSPPVRVTPPLVRRKNGRRRAASSATSPADTTRPRISSAPAGHARTHSPHRRHRARLLSSICPSALAFSGQTSMHRPHRAHRVSYQATSGRNDCDSGLWHQAHRSGQPFR